MIVCHRETIFPLVRMVRPQMPVEFTVCSTAFKSAKRDRVAFVLHLGSWREFVGGPPRARSVGFCRTLSRDWGYFWEEVVVIGVLIGNENEREEDAGAGHEHDSESCGAAYGGAFGFQQGITGRHRCGGDIRWVGSVSNRSGGGSVMSWMVLIPRQEWETADRAPAQELVGDVHDSSLVLPPSRVQGLC